MLWAHLIALPSLVCAFSVSQIPFHNPVDNVMVPHGIKPAFSFKEGSDVFSPKDLVELSRPGPGVANVPGDLVLVPVSKYSFENKKNHKAIYIAPVEVTVDPLEIPLAKGGQAFWLTPRVIAHVVPNEETKVQDIYAISVEFETEPSGKARIATPNPPVLIGSFPTSTSDNFRYVSETGVLVFSDSVYEDGELRAVKEGDEAWEGRGNSAFVYDETYVRHWDTYRGPKHKSLFSVKLAEEKGIWALGEEFTNLLAGTKHSSPVEPFGGKEDFDVSKTHVVYTTLDPELPPAWHTKQNVYVVDLEGKDRKEVTSGKHGATHTPVFSNDGTKVAWTELAEDGYESDRAVIVVYDLKRDESYKLAPRWDRSPDSLCFSRDDKYIYLTAGSEARGKVFVLPVPASKPGSNKELVSPLQLTDEHTTNSIQPLSGGRLLYSQNSFTKPNDVYVIRGLDQLPASHDTWDQDTKDLSEKVFAVAQLTRFTEGELKGKNLDAGEEFFFQGAERKIQGWILKPKGYNEGDRKKWVPLLLIHGGPQGAWEEGWSTRWNPNVFAQQGYFVVAINPSGSTTFGQDLTDAIKEDWGGKPFVDLRKGWQHILDNYPQIDADRAVAAGASYGGYAINWIQSNPDFGFGFKALVCHDGVFDSQYNGYSTDELFFFNHEFGGQPWNNHAREITKKFSPSNHVHKWSTPELIIHGSKDYRLPETDGIAAFHALQQRGVPSRLVIFPDENHWVLNHGNSLKWHYEVLRWFDEFVGKDDGN